MPYPKDLLSTRAIVRHGQFALIPPEGLVKNVIPGFVRSDISILASPALGANFAQYVVELLPQGGTDQRGFGGCGIATFAYCLGGEGQVRIRDRQESLRTHSFAYAPPSERMHLRNDAEAPMRVLLFRQRYRPLPGHSSEIVVGNAENIAAQVYDAMENVSVKDLLPSDLGFDFNMHILTFQPGGSHPFVETHVQEHGAYILSGQGVYLIDDEWIPVHQDDYIWFGPYVPQAVYATGREDLSYVYSKDCNRDVEL